MNHQADLCYYLENRKSVPDMTENEKDFLQHLCNLVAGVSSQYLVSQKGVVMDCSSEHCDGSVQVKIDPDSSNIQWHCDRCHEEGEITNWGKSFYNCLGMQEDSMH